MTSDTYTVKVGSLKAAQHMAIDMAMLLVEAMFGHWCHNPNLAITIEREDDRIKEVTEIKK